MQDRDLSAEYHEPKSGKVESLYNTFTVVRLYDCKITCASEDNLVLLRSSHPSSTAPPLSERGFSTVCGGF